MSETELSVVCKSCGAEVSPYVTECPYCGARLRKRAPELERRDGALEPKLSRRQRRRRRRDARRVGGGRLRRATTGIVGAGWLSWATLVLIAGPVIVLLVKVGAGLTPGSIGAISVPIDGEWWRFLSAPFVYDSIGYLFAVGLAVTIFTPGIERRLGTVSTVVLLAGCGVLGGIAAYGIGTAGDSGTVISGGNGIALGAIAAWFFITDREARGNGERTDLAAVVVSAAVILLLPLVVDGVDPWAGIVGGLVGGLAGLVAARTRK